MKLRNLESKDAPLMLEWMHDSSVTEKLGTDFSKKELKDCIGFIEASKDKSRDLHLAIVNDEDEYMGTVSLKHIDNDKKTAEFAITVRKEAMGKGYSGFGMKEIINIGLETYMLNRIYWCVSVENQRAIRFYDKNGYLRVQDVPAHITSNYSLEQQEKFIWYAAHSI